MANDRTAPLTVDQLVHRLQRLAPEEVDVPTVTGILSDDVLDEASLRPFVRFRDDKYARNLVHRSELFDVIVLCWKPGQATPVHNHSGQLGWVRLVRGRIEERRYELEGGGPLPDLSDVDLDDEGVGHGFGLVETGHDVVADPGTVVSVDRTRAIHALGNPDDAHTTVTLHVYSRPHDSCLVFDVAERTCRRKVLTFDGVAPV